MTPTERAALVRGLYNALGMFGATFLTTYLTTDVLRDALIVAGIAFFASLGFRAGAEGVYDSNRAKAGDVRPADVGAAVPESEWGVNRIKRQTDATA